jgi:hypothetical protein
VVVTPSSQEASKHVRTWLLSGSTLENAPLARPRIWRSAQPASSDTILGNPSSLAFRIRHLSRLRQQAPILASEKNRAGNLVGYRLSTEDFRASTPFEFVAMGDRQQLLAEGRIGKAADSGIQASLLASSLEVGAVLRDGHFFYSLIDPVHGPC